MSPWTRVALPPAPSTSRLASSAAAALPLKLIATFAPSRARRTAVARPMPRPPPVMSAVRPTSFIAAPKLAGLPCGRGAGSGGAEDQRGVVAAEAHRVGQRRPYRSSPRLVRYAVESERRVRGLVVDRRRGASIPHLEDASETTGRPRGTRQVT